MSRVEHNEPGHLNGYVRDQDSVITAHGKHDRVVVFTPQGDTFRARVDHLWGLGSPSVAEVLAVAKAREHVTGVWTLTHTQKWEDGSATDLTFYRYS